MKMIDVKRYLEKKGKGLVKLAKIGDAYVATWDTFDIDTGVKAKPVVEAIDLGSLEKLLADAVSVVKGIEALIADLKALQ